MCPGAQPTEPKPPVVVPLGLAMLKPVGVVGKVLENAAQAQ